MRLLAFVRRTKPTIRIGVFIRVESNVVYCKTLVVYTLNTIFEIKFV